MNDDTEIATELGYAPSGSLTSMTDPNQNNWTIERTGSGLEKRFTDPLGNYNENIYDDRGLRKSTTISDAGGLNPLTTTADVDVLGNVIGHNDNLLRKYDYIFDKNSDLVSTIEPENGKNHYVYDGLGRLSKVVRYIYFLTSAIPVETKYAYDPNNNLDSITDAKGNVTTYTYDGKDRLTMIEYPGGTSESVSYDKNDNVTSYTDKNGSISNYTYDDAGRLTRTDVTPASGVEGTTYKSFTFDGLGHITSTSNNDSTIEFTYDEAGRLKRETIKWKNTVEGEEVVAKTHYIDKEYDKNGNVIKIDYPSGKVLNITPDELNRISAVTSGAEQTSIVSYKYEGQTKIIEKNFKSMIKVTTTHDIGRRPVTEVHKSIPEDKIISEKTMTWNKADLKESEQGTEGDKEYIHDSAKRLRIQKEKVKDTDEVKKETEFKTDAVENIEEKKETKEGVTEKTNYKHNENNQLIEVNGVPLTYDANGNLTKYEHDYVYDWKNRLKKVITGTGLNIEYFYDTFGRRIKQTITAPNESPDNRYFVYSDWQVLEERNEADELKSRYVYGNTIDDRVEIEKSNSPLISYIPLSDNIGSVFGLADSNGAVVEKIKYTTYGTPAFIYDDNPPQVDVVRTETGNVAVRFSEPVDTASASSAIKIKQGTSELTGDLTFSDENRLVKFEPSSALPQDVTLNVNITTALRDTFENNLANEFNQDFTYTGTDLMLYDKAAPEIELIKLVGNEFFVELYEEIAAGSIAGCIELSNGTTTIDGTITAVDSKTVKFALTDNLTNNTTYTINVKSPLSDLSGKTIVDSPLTFTYRGSDLLLYEKLPEFEHKESKIKNSYLFQGRSYDHISGLYYYRARYYHPELGRFIQTDPMGYADSMNLYQAFNQNPVNFSDPMGEAYLTTGDEIRYLSNNSLFSNPMTKAALKQHGINTVRNAAYCGTAYGIVNLFPTAGPPFIFGYVCRSVTDGYIDAVKNRWENVSVFDSTGSVFWKRSTSFFMGILDLTGITGIHKSITDDTLTDDERGRLLMNSYNQSAWTTIGGIYGWKSYKKYKMQKMLDEISTSPWLGDKRVGIRMHIEEFRNGASFLMTKKQYKVFVKGKQYVGDPTGQFITTKASMNKIFKTSKGNISVIEKLLGFNKGHFSKGGGLVRVDIKNPLLHNVRFPSGLERGANTNFIWGGYTRGGMPEAIIDLVPNSPNYVDIKFID